MQAHAEWIAHLRREAQGPVLREWLRELLHQRSREDGWDAATMRRCAARVAWLVKLLTSPLDAPVWLSYLRPYARRAAFASRVEANLAECDAATARAVRLRFRRLSHQLAQQQL